MQWKTLLLDIGYQPVDIIGWRRAMELLIAGKAEIVDEYEDVSVNSVNKSFKLPSILRLIRSVAFRRRKISFSRYNIFLRDNWTCQYCGSKHKSEDLTFDHVIPKSRNSGKTWTNIVTACVPCNRKKANRTPKEAKMPLLKPPKEPRWTPQLTIRLKSDDPEEWRTYVYWYAELKET